MPLKRVILIRPGETDWNLQGRMQGWVAAPLNEFGRVQVQRLANFLRHIGVVALYSSDLRRARDTAHILAEVLNRKPQFDARLRERHIGYWQGLNVPEIHGWYYDEHEQLVKDPENYRVPGGESRAEVRERVRECVSEIIEQGASSEEPVTVAIVVHTETIRLILENLLPDTDLSEAIFGNSGVTTLAWDVESEGWQLVMMDDSTHLEGLESRHMPRMERKK
ncbi:MAG: histidine phosphatase family protein [Phototrophicaceae bacterium]